MCSVTYQIIDTCYGQNLGLDEVPGESETISLVLKGNEQLDDWTSQLPRLQGLHVYSAPLSPANLEEMSAERVIVERFNIVLSLRFLNLRILLHRPILEKFLDACAIGNASTTPGSGQRGMLQQIGISSVETCVNSAMIIISIVHTVVTSEGWRRDLLGAWNFSLFYSESFPQAQT